MRIITKDGHATMLHWLLVVFNPWTWIFNVGTIFLGGYFAFNMVMAVFKTHYGVIVEKHKNEYFEEKDINAPKTVNVRFMK